MDQFSLALRPGLGKTAALRQITRDLNPHQYLVHYIAETDFGRLDFYRQLAQRFGLHPSYRRIDLLGEALKSMLLSSPRKKIFYQY